MSGFAAEWLAARRPHDFASRAELPAGLVRNLQERSHPIHVADLGAGTGANFEFVAPRLPLPQRWTLFEWDADLQAAAAISPFDQVDYEWQTVDLATGLESALTGQVDLISASALIDLVSHNWLKMLVNLASNKGAAISISMTYDGLHAFEPACPHDQIIDQAFNEHQMTDKGFGPALGPAASDALIELLDAETYEIVAVPSPWTTGPGDRTFNADFATGLARAAKEQEPGLASTADAWLDQHLASAKAGKLTIKVGHQDVFAWPR